MGEVWRGVNRIPSPAEYDTSEDELFFMWLLDSIMIDKGDVLFTKYWVDCAREVVDDQGHYDTLMSLVAKGRGKHGA
jgi:hypothetical protein